MSRDSRVKKIEEIKQLVEFRQCTSTAFETKKCKFCVSPIYKVVHKHKLFDVA